MPHFIRHDDLFIFHHLPDLKPVLIDVKDLGWGLIYTIVYMTNS